MRKLTIAVLLSLVTMTVGAQKTVAPVPVTPESAQRIRAAYEAEDKATIALRAAQAERGRIVAEAMNEAQCFRCTLQQDEKGNLVFVKPEPPKETPKP